MSTIKEIVIDELFAIRKTLGRRTSVVDDVIEILDSAEGEEFLWLMNLALDKTLKRIRSNAVGQKPKHFNPIAIAPPLAIDVTAEKALFGSSNFRIVDGRVVSKSSPEGRA